jgi:hydroxymethylpyrimidine pyrophosphatase-like HAD family hydrolase
MSITRAIEINHFKMKEDRGWDRTFWFFDIHGTILKPNYQYGNPPKEFYPMAKETLQLISKQSDIVMILYTCSHPHEIEEYLQFFKENDINFKYVNENPEVVTDVNGYGNYDKKPYMNVLLEDKSGFNPDNDWFLVYDLLTQYYA